MIRPQRIVPARTAFTLSHGRKRPRQHQRDHLRWLRTLPCLVTGRRVAIEAAHIRYADLRFGKRETGVGEKPSDMWAVPLHAELHWAGKEAQHNASEVEWWRAHGIDPVAAAAALWAASGDDEAAEVIIREARK